MVRYPYLCYFNAFGNHETTRLNTSNKNSQSKHGYSLHVPFTSSFSAALRGLHLRNDQNHWDFISRTKDFIHGARYFQRNSCNMTKTGKSYQINGNSRIQYMEVRVLYHFSGHRNWGYIPWNLALKFRPWNLGLVYGRYRTCLVSVLWKWAA